MTNPTTPEPELSPELTQDLDVDPALATAVLEIEAHIAAGGWDQPARLYALVDFQGGNRKFNKEWWNRCPWGIDGNCAERVYPERFDSRHIAETQMGDIGISSTALESGSFAKLREISLSMTLPSTWTGRLGAKQASLSVAARNLHTWTQYTGFDPEGLSTDAYGASRWGDQGAVPQLAQFLTTINITF